MGAITLPIAPNLTLYPLPKFGTEGMNLDHHSSETPTGAALPLARELVNVHNLRNPA